MKYEFTPAAQRAVCHAAAWLGRNDCSESRGAALLLGLLAQGECRAAAMLARCHLDAAAVHARWTGLVAPEAASCGCSEPPVDTIPGLEVFFHAAAARLANFPRPLVLATEHLLLGLAAAEGETAEWLRGRGLDADALEVEIHQLYGYQRGGGCRRRPQNWPVRRGAEPRPGADRRAVGGECGNSPPADHRRRRQSGPGGPPRGRGLCPLRPGRSPPDRTAASVCGTTWRPRWGDCPPAIAWRRGKPRPTWARRVTTAAEQRRADAGERPGGQFLAAGGVAPHPGGIRQTAGHRHGAPTSSNSAIARTRSSGRWNFTRRRTGAAGGGQALRAPGWRLVGGGRWSGWPAD